MKILCSDSQNDRKRIYDLAMEIVNLLERENISGVELWDYKPYGDDMPVAEISIEIDGDWKHDHLRADYLVKENFVVFKIETRELEDTGSDWGPELHTYYVSTR